MHSLLCPDHARFCNRGVFKNTHGHTCTVNKITYIFHLFFMFCLFSFLKSYTQTYLAGCIAVASHLALGTPQQGIMSRQNGCRKQNKKKNMLILHIPIKKDVSTAPNKICFMICSLFTKHSREALEKYFKR